MRCVVGRRKARAPQRLSQGGLQESGSRVYSVGQTLAARNHMFIFLYVFAVRRTKFYS
jgi:hypothetical protein